MKDVSYWWALPGPAGFLSRLVSDLASSGIVVVECPRPAPEGLVEAIKNKLAGGIAIDAIQFDGSRIREGQSIVHELAMSTGIAGSSIGTIGDFLEAAGVYETAFVVDGIQPDAVVTWGAFIRAVKHERQRTSAIAGPYLVIFQPPGLTKDNAARLRGTAKIRRVVGIASSIDTYAWAAANGTRFGSGLMDRTAIATSLEVAAWSRELLGDMLRWDEEDQLFPQKRLAEIAQATAWPFPCWENGLVDLWDDAAVPHAAAAVAHGFEAEVVRRIWVAQSRTILPFVDSARRGLIRKYIDILEERTSVQNPYLRGHESTPRPITNPWELELNDILILLSSDLTDAETKGAVAFRNVRNNLAHFKPVDARTLKMIADWWELFLDILPAAVPGWSWPRVGQKLMLTVGPSGAGKSHWVEAQGTKSISVRGLAAELRQKISGLTPEGMLRVARERAAKILEAGSDVVIDHTHMSAKERRINAQSMPTDLQTEYVIIDSMLDEKLHRQPDQEKMIRESHLLFQDQIANCLIGDKLPNVTVKDKRSFKI
ncbi:hypothetical protein GCM10007874_00070 [Labrys miyagiensis]|uniref:AAA family ATPase n=1 Tax=Labrys miyagiensis TaxID=346912 RepID=A0ABQ6CFI5_9HYPH|nr:AAA family ATPase [Labrys miyagiensis]GLS16992.1 hypothetical protein GCM10007874_00070 [Labrys miyagiensis]